MQIMYGPKLVAYVPRIDQVVLDWLQSKKNAFLYLIPERLVASCGDMSPIDSSAIKPYLVRQMFLHIQGFVADMPTNVEILPESSRLFFKTAVLPDDILHRVFASQYLKPRGVETCIFEKTGQFVNPSLSQ